MAMTIKNERVHELARRASELTGKSQVGAIEEALERLLRDLGADPIEVAARHKIDVVRQIALEYVADPGERQREVRSADDLYDEVTGLPR